MSWTRARREKWAFAVLLAFVIGAAAIAAVPDSPNQAVSAETTSPQPSYDLSGRIVTREHADGRIEFCFEPTSQELVCPDLRFLDPGKVRPNRWIHSSEISWDVPIEPELVLYEQPTAADDSCELDFERMFAATWKVETTRARGTAFSIGDGRFVTAHHVIEDVPPYLTLTHGDRAVAAGVLGSDPEHDVALLEVFDPALVADVPAVEFRNPTKADVGAPVYLVGYPSAGALTAATGIITRVWEDEILTNSSSQGGNSGGPMFDACGDVLGVLWAGSRVSNFSHSGEVLQTALAALPKQKPLVVAELPTWLTPPGVAVWHYAALPPRGVDCVGVEGEWWIGLAGTDWWELENRPTDLNSEGQCGWGTTNVVALSSRPIEMSEDSEPGCVERYGPDGDGEITSVLHEADGRAWPCAPGRAWSHYTLPVAVHAQNDDRPPGTDVFLVIPSIRSHRR